MRSRIPLLIALLVTAFSVHGQIVERDQPGSGRMTINNYMINHPSFPHMVEGLRAYSNGEFKRAYGRFRLASNWANKHAQAWIGWMYTLGQGVELDVPRAYAWLKLAAERGYPTFVEDVQALSEAMTDQEIAHGELILRQELMPSLGDEARVRRTSMQMWRDKMRVSGSRVGYTGNLQIVSHSDLGDFYGGAFYAEDRWDLKRVIQFETQLHFAMARTTIKLHDLYLPGEIESIPKPPDEDEDEAEAADQEDEEN